MSREIGPLRALASGALCLGILGMAGLGTLKVAGKNWQVQEVERLRAEFEGIGGLEVGGRVFMQGIDAGVVEAIEAPEVPGDPVRLVLRIDAALRPLIRADAEARIASQGVVGAKVVEITPGSPDAPELPDGGAIPSARPIELSGLMAEAAGALERLDEATAEAVEGLGQITAIASAINDGEGTLGRLLRDDEPVDRLVRLADRGERTLGDLEDNMDAVANTWPISRYYRNRGFDDRDLALYRPDASHEGRTFPEADLFEPGRAILTERGKHMLDAMARWSEGRLTGATEVVIASYTDDRLDDDMAERLTQRQAEAVRRYLADEHDLDSLGWFRSRTVAAVGFGARTPRAPGLDGSDRPARRIEVHLFTPRA